MLQLEAPVNTTAILGQSQQLVPDVATQAAQRQLMQAQAAEANQALQFRQIALQRQQSFGQDMQNFLQAPNASGVAQLFGKYPEFQQQIGDAWNTMDAAQKRSSVSTIGSIIQMARAGDMDGAASALQQKIAADDAAGQDTNVSRQMLAELQSGDPKRINAAIGTGALVIGAAYPDKAKDFLSSIGLDQTPQKLSPGEKEVNAVTGQTVASSPALSTPQILNTPSGGQNLYGFNPNDGSINGGGGAASTQPGGGGPASGGGAAYPAGTPRSVRNNNPGNLRSSPFTNSQPGFTGTDNAGYATFDSPQSGQAAQVALLSGKGYFGGGRNTVASIISKWAPPKSAGGDNTNAQVANYVAYVSKQLGVKPGDALSSQQIPQLAQAMSQFEAGATGRAGAVRVPPASASQGPSSASAVASAQVSGPQPLVSTAPPNGLDTKGAEPGYAWNSTRTAQVPIPGTPNDPNSYSPQEIDDLARNWISTGPTAFASLGGGMGGGGIAQLKKAALARASEIMAQSGITADQLPAIRSKFSALNSSMTQNTQILNMLEASEKALHANAQQVMKTQQPLVDAGIISDTSPWLNRTRLETYSHVGSAATKANIAAYEDAVNGLTQEYTKFMNSANGMGGNAAPSDSARHLAIDLNDPGYGPATMNKHINQIFTETGNKRTGIGAQNDSIQSQLSSLIGGRPQQSELPAGAKVIGTYQGRRVIEVNGQRLVEQ